MNILNNENHILMTNTGITKMCFTIMLLYKIIHIYIALESEKAIFMHFPK